MRNIFTGIALVVIYKLILDYVDDYIVLQIMMHMMLLDMLRNVGNIVLILILCLSIRDTIKNMKRQERISRFIRANSHLPFYKGD
jgi:hypothetical protein